jgi:hypothetical protein
LSVTTVFCSNEASQAAPQEIPAGDETTVPVASPIGVTNSEKVVGAAKTTASRVNVALHAPLPVNAAEKLEAVPEQCPDHPANLEPWAAVAASVIMVPLG